MCKQFIENATEEFVKLGRGHFKPKEQWVRRGATRGSEASQWGGFARVWSVSGDEPAKVSPPLVLKDLAC